jgi:hypothetical protein
MKRAKKLISLVLSMVMLLSITAGINLSAYAETMPEGVSNGFQYATNTEDGTMMLLGYKGTAPKTLEFPSKIKGKAVTQICYYFAHYNGGVNFNKVKKVVIPASIVKIDDDTLCADCFTNLKDIYYTGTKAQWNKIEIGYSFGKNSEAISNSTIHYNYITNSQVKLSKTKYTYDGKAKKPTVTVKDSNGNKISSKYYTVKYSKGRTKVGKYKVTVTMKDKYSGTVTKSFKIVPKSTSISKLTSKKKSIVVKWKKRTTQTTGYQIKYSTKSSMSGAKKLTIKNASTTSKTISNLKSNTKYYVQVRTYKSVNGKKFYSAWSSKKSVKTSSSSSSKSKTVYITATGKCYHYDSKCGNGKYYKSTYAEAKKKGLKPCKKCVG